MEPLTTVDYADTFFADRLHTDLWDAASSEERRKAINHASSDIRKYFVLHEDAFQEWIEHPSEKQIVIADSRVQNAVCLQAIYLLSVNPADYPEALTKGVSSASAGPLNATFDKSFIPLPIAIGVEEAIGELGTYIGPTESGTARTMPLYV